MRCELAREMIIVKFEGFMLSLAGFHDLHLSMGLSLYQQTLFDSTLVYTLFASQGGLCIHKLSWQRGFGIEALKPRPNRAEALEASRGLGTNALEPRPWNRGLTEPQQVHVHTRRKGATPQPHPSISKCRVPSWPCHLCKPLSKQMLLP